MREFAFEKSKKASQDEAVRFLRPFCVDFVQQSYAHPFDPNADSVHVLGHWLDIRNALSVLQSTGPALLRWQLAMVLRRFSHQLARVGKRQDAFDAVKEAVLLLRKLHDEDATNREYGYFKHLIHALNDLSSRGYDLGQREAALNDINEAVERLRRQPRDAKSGTWPGHSWSSLIAWLESDLTEMRSRPLINRSKSIGGCRLIAKAETPT